MCYMSIAMANMVLPPVVAVVALHLHPVSANWGYSANAGNSLEFKLQH